VSGKFVFSTSNIAGKFIFFFLVLLSLQAFCVADVYQSPRNIPIVDNVDVLVAGGSSAGVQAAVDCANSGLSVLLLSQEPYLGADLCATKRFLVETEDGEFTLLGKKLFNDTSLNARMTKGLAFSYTTDQIPTGRLRDLPKGKKFADGFWDGSELDGLEYDKSLTVTADVKSVKDIEEIHLISICKQKKTAIESVCIEVSSDGKTYTKAAVIKDYKPGEDNTRDFSISLDTKARYIKFTVNKAADAESFVVTEIVIFDQNENREKKRAPSPMHIKRMLDKALLDSGVKFLYGCYATDVLFDKDEQPAGLIVANRAGRQAIKAKVIIDATDNATVARLANAEFNEASTKSQSFKRIIIGGKPLKGEKLICRKITTLDFRGIVFTPDFRSATDKEPKDVFEYTLTIDMPDRTYASYAAAEQTARDLTFCPEMLDASDKLFYVPGDSIISKKNINADMNLNHVDIDAFRPRDFDRFFVLNGCASVERKNAEKLLGPGRLMPVAKQIAAAAAGICRNSKKPATCTLQNTCKAQAGAGDIREVLTGFRPTSINLPAIKITAQSMPVLGEYDVVVIGGGTGGSPAGIGAARNGAKTLVVEYLNGLGGVGTMGYIANYWYGNRKGFSAEMDKEAHIQPAGKKWNPIIKMNWYRSEIRKAGGDIWFSSIGCGAFVEGNQVKGVVVATPFGRGVVLAKTVIDSTGSADIAIAAGGDYVFTDEQNAAIQGTGLPPKELGSAYMNTDYTETDDSDMLDVWRTFVTARVMFSKAWDMGQLIDSRERRRIVGDYTLNPLDIYTGRTFSDSVVYARSNFDSHGFSVHPIFLLRAPDMHAVSTYIPFRCMLPEGLEGIAVTGLGVSAHRDAMPIIRMQADIQNQGYAIGTAAAMAVAEKTTIRNINIKKLQRKLVDMGALGENVLTDSDSWPISETRLRQAISLIVEDFKDIEFVLACGKRAIEPLKNSYKQTQNPAEKMIYAQTLAILQDTTGLDTLIEAVKNQKWDDGWTFKKTGQFGASMSRLDSVIIAVAKTKDDRAIDCIKEKLDALDENSGFSHYRAISMASETFADPVFAPSLARLIRSPGIMGYALTDINKAIESRPHSGLDKANRVPALREIILARALYRCGDHEGLGQKILTEYSHDIRGHYARHASAILAQGY
jgi:hypothetical protein